MRLQRAFTLIEVLATLLLLAIGMAAVTGLMRFGTRVSMDAQMRSTALLVAETVTVDATPGGKTADVGDLDNDGWMLVTGPLAAPATGDYAFVIQGHIDGYYVRRTESSAAGDILDPSQRWAHITVDVYAGNEDRFLTSVRQRYLRHTRAP